MTIAHDRDFYAWTQNQAQLLRTGQFDILDIQQIAEEIEDMGRTEKRALESRLEVLIMHLLKWQYQPSLRSRSWQLTVREQRLRVYTLLEDNPSLQPHLSQRMDKIYRLAVIAAERETGLTLFPETCPYRIEEILSENFFE
ncbi:MAG: hypothetical protein AUK48_01635 [Oscillatoriales cyanobacterium CG2_30_44_21]|nr:MAG: hypothetical protein AUK48_01635 [Oscillatoriales cyanobacterium CG2_30_44_21]